MADGGDERKGMRPSAEAQEARYRGVAGASFRAVEVARELRLTRAWWDPV